MVSFVRGGNLFVVGADGRGERALTSDGGTRRAQRQAGLGLPGGGVRPREVPRPLVEPRLERLAFLRLDETDVPRYTLVDDVDRPHPGRGRALPAGPGTRTRRRGWAIVRAAGGPVVWMDASRYPADILIVDVVGGGQRAACSARSRTASRPGWTRGRGAHRGKPSTLVREQGKAWVDRAEDVQWLKDGSLLWPSERTGWQHLYRYKRDGTLLGAVTSGPWEVRAVHGVDEAGGWVYFSGTERSHIGGDVYRVRLDGSARARLSATPGTHAAIFNPSLTLYLDTWSDAHTPPQVRLHRADGTLARVIDENTAAGAGRVPPGPAGAPPGEDPRRVPHGGHAAQAARLRSRAALSRLPAHLRRPPRAPGQERLGRDRPGCSTSSWPSAA